MTLRRRVTALKEFQRLLLAILLLLACGLDSVAGRSDEPSLLRISIPQLEIHPGERVVGFRIDLKAAAIRGLDHIPLGWSISIDNDASWSTTIKATVEVGAAVLDPTYFRNFLTVQKYEYGNLKFELRGDVYVTKDFQTSRRIKLTDRDFEVQDRTAQ